MNSLRSALCKPYTGVNVYWIGKTHLQESDKFFIILFFLCSDSQPVNFKHLLSMGYQRDWFDEQGQKANQERAEQKVFINTFCIILVSRVAKKCSQRLSEGCSVITLSIIMPLVLCRIKLLNVLHTVLWQTNVSSLTGMVCKSGIQIRAFKK